MAGTNSNVFDAQLMHAVFLQRAYTSISNAFTPYLKKIDRAVRDALDISDERITGKRQLNSIVAQVKKDLGTIWKDWDQEQIALLNDLIENEIDFQNRIYQKESDRIDGPSFIIPDAESVQDDFPSSEMVLDGQATTFEQSTQSLYENETNRITSVIVGGAVAGITVAEITRNIRGTRANNFNDGTLATVRRNQDAVTRTGANQAASNAQLSYISRQRSIVGYEIVATLDSRTSNICKGYDGQVVLKEDDFQPRPPFHYRCRTGTTAVFSDESGMVTGGGVRASRGASGGQQVSGDLTYYDWLKRQPAWFQDQALGKERGLIFRNAGLTASEFRAASIGRFNQPLTIDEMKQKDDRIAEYLDQ